MNNFNIHLEIRNPKKQAIDMKLEAMACYPMNRRTEEQRNESRGTTENHLGLGFQCGGRSTQCRHGEDGTGAMMVAVGDS